MIGGEYYTVFKDDDKRKIRKILYHLENRGIIRIESKKLKNQLDSEIEKNLSNNVKNIAKNVKDKRLKNLLENWKPSVREYNWRLTKKGKEIVGKDKNLQNLWEEKRIVDFYNSIKNFLYNQK